MKNRSCNLAITDRAVFPKFWQLGLCFDYFSSSSNVTTIIKNNHGNLAVESAEGAGASGIVCSDLSAVRVRLENTCDFWRPCGRQVWCKFSRKIEGRACVRDGFIPQVATLSRYQFLDLLKVRLLNSQNQ